MDPWVFIVLAIIVGLTIYGFKVENDEKAKKKSEWDRCSINLNSSYNSPKKPVLSPIEKEAQEMIRGLACIWYPCNKVGARQRFRDHAGDIGRMYTDFMEKVSHDKTVDRDQFKSCATVQAFAYSYYYAMEYDLRLPSYNANDVTLEMSPILAEYFSSEPDDYININNIIAHDEEIFTETLFRVDSLYVAREFEKS